MKFTFLTTNIAALRQQIDSLQKVCASAYQLAGIVGAPVRFLDALSDAANGEIRLRQDIDFLLPVSLYECEEFTAILQQLANKDAEIAQFRHLAETWQQKAMEWSRENAELRNKCQSIAEGGTTFAERLAAAQEPMAMLPIKR